MQSEVQSGHRTLTKAMLMKLTMHQVQRSASPHANWASRHPPVKGGFDIWVANRQHHVPPFPWERSASTPAPQGQGCGMVASCRSVRVPGIAMSVLQAREDSCTYGGSNGRPMGRGDPTAQRPAGDKQRGSIGCGRTVMMVPATCLSFCGSRF